MPDNEYIIQQCYHCGNKGLMKTICQHEHEFGGPIFDEFDNIVSVEFREKFEWTLLECCVCHMVTLRRVCTDETSDFNFDDTILLYPTNTISYLGVPDNIKAAFEAALKVKNIDTSICLLSLRRVLEAICKQQGAEGKDLNAMIKDLLDKGKLPEQMNDACWIIRQLGNKAAHADEVLFYSYEVEQTIDFLVTIMKYIYILPIQMKQLKDRITEEREV
jgi:hypothetical protein